jgi:hypothetical protein
MVGVWVGARERRDKQGLIIGGLNISGIYKTDIGDPDKFDYYPSVAEYI